MGESSLRQADHGQQLKPLQQEVTDVLQRRVGKDAVRQHHGGAAGSRLEELPYPFDEQDFRFLVLAGLASPFGVLLYAQCVIGQVRPFCQVHLGAERWIGEDKVEAAFLETIVAGALSDLFKAVQRVLPNNVAMAVVVKDHVHLGDAGDFVVDLHAVQILLGEVVPVRVMLHTAGFVVLRGLAADFVEGVEQKSAGAARGIKHQLIRLGPCHVRRESDNLARGEILAEITLEKAVHELLERHALGVQVSLAETYGFHVGNKSAERGVIYAYGVGENLRVALFRYFINGLYAFGQLAGRFVGLYLEFIGLAVLARSLFVLNLDEEQFAKFTESHGRGEPPPPHKD